MAYRSRRTRVLSRQQPNRYISAWQGVIAGERRPKATLSSPPRPQFQDKLDIQRSTSFVVTPHHASCTVCAPASPVARPLRCGPPRHPRLRPPHQQQAAVAVARPQRHRLHVRLDGLHGVHHAQHGVRLPACGMREGQQPVVFGQSTRGRTATSTARLVPYPNLLAYPTPTNLRAKAVIAQCREPSTQPLQA